MHGTEFYFRSSIKAYSIIHLCHCHPPPCQEMIKTEIYRAKIRINGYDFLGYLPPPLSLFRRRCNTLKFSYSYSLDFGNLIFDISN